MVVIFQPFVAVPIQALGRVELLGKVSPRGSRKQRQMPSRRIVHTGRVRLNGSRVPRENTLEL